MIRISASERSLIAAGVGIGDQYLYQCLTGRRTAPADKAAAIERFSSGKLMRWHLRPADWHLIWPELVGRSDAPPVIVSPGQTPTSNDSVSRSNALLPLSTPQTRGAE